MKNEYIFFRPPFDTSDEYIKRRNGLVKLSNELLLTSQRDSNTSANHAIVVKIVSKLELLENNLATHLK